MPFKFYDAPTIAERVHLGRELNRLEGYSIVPFPATWEPEDLMQTFRTDGANSIHALRHKGYESSALFLYPDEDGSWIYGVLRMDHPELRKQVLPIRATRAVGLHPFLEVKAIDAPRPLYGLNLLASRPDDPVIVVEGEKAADAGQQCFPDHVVITWPGGAGGVNSADWRPLSRRDVVIWPDNDKPGSDAAETIADLLADVGAASVRIVPLPAHFPEKWDVADELPEAADA